MIVKEFSEINLDNNLARVVDLKDKNDFYLIGVTKSKDIKSITFEVSIDSGVKGKPLFIQNIRLEITGEISGARFLNMPSEFYIKPIQIINKDGKTLKEGKFPVAININAMDLG